MQESSRRESLGVHPDVEHRVLIQVSRLSLRNTKTTFSEHGTPSRNQKLQSKLNSEADSGLVEENPDKCSVLAPTTGSSRSDSTIQQHRQRSQSERRKTNACQGTRERRSCSPDIPNFTPKNVPKDNLFSKLGRLSLRRQNKAR